MRKTWNALFLTPRFFLCGLGVAACFVLSFFYPAVFVFAQFALSVWILFSLLDFLLFAWSGKGLEGKREVAPQLSHSDENPIALRVQSHLRFTAHCWLQEVLPEELEMPIQGSRFHLGRNQFKVYTYGFRPMQRGEYRFARFLVFARSFLGLVERKYELGERDTFRVYPSFVHLQKKRLAFIHQKKNLGGQNLQRKFGHSQEFEQIRNYVQGDDIRTVNWKATAKARELRVNQYQEERAQSIYCIIDKGRMMRHASQQKSLLDESINNCLIMSQMILDNHDRVGLCSFSNGIEDFLLADNRSGQMQKVFHALYNLRTDFKESDFGALYTQLKRKVKQRSMLFLYTQFDSLDAMERQLPYLRAINKLHVLVVIFFRNEELIDHASSHKRQVPHYEKAIAQRFLYEQERIAKELGNYGINAVLTTPKNLSIDSLNKYLTLKSKALL